MADNNLIIIGGGAAGMAAACAAGQTALETQKNIRVYVLEKNARVGKKLYATGNGRCNLSNNRIEPSFYHSHSPAVARVLSACSPPDVNSFFSRIGLHTTTEDGRIYPYSQTAASVLDVLRMEMDRLNITVLNNNQVDQVGLQRHNDKESAFYVNTQGGKLYAQALIVATGGKAAPHTGSDGGGYEILKRLGHVIFPVFPVLAPLTARHPSLKMLKGIRAKPCRVSLLAGGKIIASDIGEVLFTEYGLSGVPALQVSGALYGRDNVQALLDLLPEASPEQTVNMLTERRLLRPGSQAEHLFTGWLHRRLGQALLQEASVHSFSTPVMELNDDVSHQLSILLKRWPLPITGTKGFSFAQATGGGASLDEFSPETMASRVHPGLYAAGEVLDVYGDCGGYNLHWAWVTGLLAGGGAVRMMR